MNALKTLLLSIALILSPLSIAEETKADKYEGIEITVNINTATAQELATLLKGIGQSKAEKIVEYRDANGKFKSADELAEVKGIGNATVEKNRERIKL
ncbi:ComEA family DNA-binding protein [Vibrio sp. SCSIO 43136]|uniref:ComEA family DNA-binding protein n=1 Tax=Vibrio sp. SCSIO 43136 TaxID=2819101 RepID=UPI002075D3BC|nr:ComEA family DNA-binding protein [Vibrio sp. SCSIO 43136]USD64471.1 helix-hairpin-helix domain-containing protein [Vibrio sp. SCSIO 43136]